MKFHDISCSGPVWELGPPCGVLAQNLDSHWKFFEICKILSKFPYIELAKSAEAYGFAGNGLNSDDLLWGIVQLFNV